MPSGCPAPLHPSGASGISRRATRNAAYTARYGRKGLSERQNLEARELKSPLSSRASLTLDSVHSAPRSERVVVERLVRRAHPALERALEDAAPNADKRMSRWRRPRKALQRLRRAERAPRPPLQGGAARVQPAERLVAKQQRRC
eukprot:7389968-Prymnesium_polylepis.1